MPKYIKAKSGPKNSVIYSDSNGKQWAFEGGNRPWRNQNPGDLVPGKVSKRNGAIGSATEAYIRFIQKRTDVTSNKKIKDFSKSEFEKLWKAIEQMEGWGKKSGTIRALEKKAQITGVSKDRHGIIDTYQIEGYGWVSKDEGIALTQQGKVDAVVAVSPQGHAFLRGRPNHAIS